MEYTGTLTVEEEKRNIVVEDATYVATKKSLKKSRLAEIREANNLAIIFLRVKGLS